jgi:hypothetical protein
MKSINDIITESKAGPLKKLDMLTIMLAYQMWKEYKLYDEFFEKLNEEELEDYENLMKQLEKLDNDNSRVQWSLLKKYFNIISKTCDYILNSPDDEFSKSDKKIWSGIKRYVS